MRVAHLLLGLPLVHAPTALAQDAYDDRPGVLVGRIEPVSAESAGLAALLESQLEVELARHPGLRLVARADALAVASTDAATYLESCPPGEAEGCALVVAQAGGVEYGLAGSVEVGPGGAHVVIGIVDAVGLTVPVRLDARLAPDTERDFVRALARLVGEVERGEHAPRDLRSAPDARESDRQALLARLQRELDDLAQEIPNLRLELEAGVRADQRPALSAAQVHALMESDSAAFREVGLPADEYLAWWNSQEPLDRWRLLGEGRAGRVLVRVHGGILAGPVEGAYHGVEAIDPESFEVSEFYAWQALRQGVGAGGRLALGYGLAPAWEVGAYAAWLQAPYEAVESERLAGQGAVGDPEPITGNNSLLITGIGARWVPRPHARVRPALAAGLTWWHGAAASTREFAPPEGFSDPERLPDDLPVFPAPNLFGLEASVGAELRLAPWLDLLADLPVFLLVGRAVETSGSATGEFADEPAPPTLVPVGAGLLLGAQVRIGRTARAE